VKRVRTGLSFALISSAAARFTLMSDINQQAQGDATMDGPGKTPDYFDEITEDDVLTDWEHDFLASVGAQDYPLTDAQEAKLAEIEAAIPSGWSSPGKGAGRCTADGDSRAARASPHSVNPAVIGRACALQEACAG
jgi:hypothetical protein